MAAKEFGLPVERKVNLGKGVSMTLVLVPPGSGVMGSDDRKVGPDGEPDWPSHTITMTRPFYIGKYEVTQAQWKRVMGKNPSRWQKGRKWWGYAVNEDTPECPVDSVKYGECLKFAKRLTALVENGMLVRLPTEAEWEYACRAQTRTLYCFGEREARLAKYAWFEQNSGGHPHAVGKLRGNAWGLHDMHGNLAEYCLDWRGTYDALPKTNPVGGDQKLERRAVRGGSFGAYPIGCRSASRQTIRYYSLDSSVARQKGYASNPGRNLGYGLRVVISVPAQEAVTKQ